MGGRARDGEEGGGLQDGLLERWRPLLATKGGDLVHDAAAARGFAEDGYAGFVAAEEVDVGLDPLQGEALIVEGRLGSAIVLLNAGAGEKA